MNTTHTHEQAGSGQRWNADSGTDSATISHLGQHSAAVRCSRTPTRLKSLKRAACRERTWCAWLVCKIGGKNSDV